MVSVIADMQLDPATNVINNGLSVQELGADLGSAAFPAGSRINRRTSLTLAPSITISSLTTDGRSQSEAQTLEQLIAAKPASGVSLPSASHSLGLGLGSGPLKHVRVAFTGVTSTTAGTVQFYECDLDTTQSVASNCAASDTGTYSSADGRYRQLGLPGARKQDGHDLGVQRLAAPECDGVGRDEDAAEALSGEGAGLAGSPALFQRRRA